MVDTESYFDKITLSGQFKKLLNRYCTVVGLPKRFISILSYFRLK